MVRVWPVVAGTVASALSVAAYARGAWPLGFVMLVPWLLALGRGGSMRTGLTRGLAMAAGFVAAALGWFALAISDYTGLASPAAYALLLLLAPVLQPQIVAFAIVRGLAGRAGPLVGSAAAIAAWLAVEWWVPRLFGDTLGHGLQPARLLRQGADLAGAAGLTLVLLVINDAVARALESRGAGPRAWLRPLALAAVLPPALAAYGALRLSTLTPSDGPAVRIGLVQAAIVDYERRRREQGAYAVVRDVLDTHYALSVQLRARGAQALVWPESVYPTTFGQPRNDVGASLDRELAGFVRDSGLPLVLGTYERDSEGEFVVAAFVDPARGRLGAYRKTRLFPLTEYVPAALDGAALRRHMPWAGSWSPGDGARVFPLNLPDGREVPVAPLICRDDVDPALARDAARLGAEVLLGLSNDAWFTRAPLGAELHLRAAAFRSIETRLPQVRATTNGLSAVVDATGAITAVTAMGERTTLLAEVVPRAATPTLAMRWGDWLGPAATGLLVLLALMGVRSRRGPPLVPHRVEGSGVAGGPSTYPRVLLLAPWQRIMIGALRAFSRSAVLVFAVMALWADEPPRVLAEIQRFALWVLVPELAAALLARACRARLVLEPAQLVIESAGRSVEIERSRVRSLEPWRIPWPSPGVDIVFADGRRWTQAIGLRDAHGLMRAHGGRPRGAAPDPLSPLRGASGSPASVRDGAVPEGAPRDGTAVGPDAAGDASLAGVGRSPAAAADDPKAPTRDGDDERVGPGAGPRVPAFRMRMLEALAIAPRRIDHPLIKFVLFPLVPALPAFRLHQVIAYGGPFGEYYSFGAQAYLTGLGLWWASWAVKLVLLAGGLRAGVELTSGIVLALRPQIAPQVRRRLLGLARLAYFVGVPVWLAVRVLG